MGSTGANVGWYRREFWVVRGTGVSAWWFRLDWWVVQTQVLVGIGDSVGWYKCN